MKVIVRIHTKSRGLEIKKVKVLKEDKLRLDKDWKPKMVGYEVRHLRFGRQQNITDINEGSSETWTYGKDIKPEDQPELTQAQVTRYAKAKIWEKRYQTEAKTVQSWLLYAILGVQIASAIVIYLTISGRLHL